MYGLLLLIVVFVIYNLLYKTELEDTLVYNLGVLIKDDEQCGS